MGLSNLCHRCKMIHCVRRADAWDRSRSLLHALMCCVCAAKSKKKEKNDGHPIELFFPPPFFFSSLSPSFPFPSILGRFLRARGLGKVSISISPPEVSVKRSIWGVLFRFTPCLSPCRRSRRRRRPQRSAEPDVSAASAAPRRGPRRKKGKKTIAHTTAQASGLGRPCRYVVAGDAIVFAAVEARR